MGNSSDYWRDYFGNLQGDEELASHEKIAMSNDRVQYQTYVNALEGLGSVAGRVGLDAGCGMGVLTRLLRHLGADMDGFDIVEGTIEGLRASEPDVGWFVADINDPTSFSPPRTYDFVAAVEILQHVDPENAIRTLWGHLRPGGRLVASAPNAKCPIIQRVVERFDGNYHGVEIPALSALGAELPDVAGLYWRGAYFQDDQTVVPYGLTPWQHGDEPLPSDSPVPNRWHFVLIKQGDEGAS